MSPDEKEDKEPTIVKGLSQRLIHFSPSWYSVTMGTGVNCSLLLNLPWPTVVPYVKHIAVAFLLGNTMLFVAFTAIIVFRYTKYPEFIQLTLRHSQYSLFLGCMPMGLLTILSGIGTASQVHFGLGDGFTLAASYVWWLAVAISCFVALIVPYMQFTTHSHASESYTASLLLPIVPTITSAATGGTLCALLAPNHPSYAFAIWITSYCILGIGLSLAMMILGLYLQRLTFHHLPASDVIVSVFLPLGPCGQGGFALLQLGRCALLLGPTLPPHLTLASTGIYAIGLLCALSLFGLGMWWWVLAVGSFLAAKKQHGRLSFNMGWWGFTFPLASLTLCTLLISDELDSFTLKVIGTGMVLLVLCLWVFVAVKTCKGAIEGTVFQAPCLAGWRASERREMAKESESSAVEMQDLEEDDWNIAAIE